MNFFNKTIINEINFLCNFFDSRFILGESKKTFNAQNVNEVNRIDKSLCKKLIILDGDLNHSLSIKEKMDSLRTVMNRDDRIVIVAYNPYLNPLYKLANLLHIRLGALPQNQITKSSLSSIVKISDFEIVKIKQLIYFPFFFLGLGYLINSFLSLFGGLFKDFAICQLFILRPTRFEKKLSTLSIIIPVRNEEGNLEEIFKKLKNLTFIKKEIIFVEGNSQDKTWETLNDLSKFYQESLPHIIMKQPSKGKQDAVNAGIENTTGELITILDGDITVPVENLNNFYQAFINGHGDFINGNRLFYPTEQDAMRPLNWMGNLFFAKLISYIFSNLVSDTLCGTKLFTRKDLVLFRKWKKQLRINDPFGDFELLMPALDLGIGVVDIPIHYKSRSYGSTNIHRFKDGFLLLKICMRAFWIRKVI